ncbi:MAG: hypothetical protein ABIZ81_11830 [Opitutaceae bacterium]
MQETSFQTKPVTFSEKFCTRRHIPLTDYENEMLRVSLYFPGRLVRLVLNREASYFAPDREFIRAVGKLPDVHGFDAEVWAYTINPENSRFHRLHLKMRVSAKKIYQQMREILGPDLATLPGVLVGDVPPI